MRQLGEKKKPSSTIWYFITLQVFKLGQWGGGGGDFFFFFFPEKNWSYLLKKGVFLVLVRLESIRDRVCHWYEAVLCYRKRHWWSYVYPFKLADKGNCIFSCGKCLLYLNGFSLFGEINGVGVKPPDFFENRNYSRICCIGSSAVLPL